MLQVNPTAYKWAIVGDGSISGTEIDFNLQIQADRTLKNKVPQQVISITATGYTVTSSAMNGSIIVMNFSPTPPNGTIVDGTIVLGFPLD